ncbi:hypothetical protein N7474_009600 [Penicillium riverlandense]|uniref:uncharacterized protein n=1 Tax=Penicillium riverlandense TaxID=1903569 RepID=UPI002548B297|nr:uncharacterized protein N7474_009600 [Penicillium riverlandense]KAJ5808331.1 hypothetical protein N7474_009600 [Penicillium riverlandense]
MHLQRSFVATVLLFIPASLALSDYANQVLGDISATSKLIQKHEDTLNLYKGGITAAVPLAQEAYDIWRSLRIANVHLDDTTFTTDESDAIVADLTSANEVAIRLFGAYQEKEPLLNQAGVGFVAPILMQAIYREVDDYAVPLKQHMPQQYAARMERLKVTHTAAWDAAFSVYDPASNPIPSHPYMKFVPALLPALGLLI